MSQTNFVRFRDYVSLEPLAVDPKKRQLFECKDSTSSTGFSLDTLADLTFSGIVTKNKAMYLPGEVSTAAQSFVKPYNKPVQIHHQDHVDPVGRVVSVRYLDSNASRVNGGRDFAIKNKFGSEILKKDFAIKDLRGRDAAGLFGELSMLSAQDGYTGLGRIRGHLRITDSEAIKKVLDGRYLTLSSGFRTAHAYCSTCLVNGDETDWADSICEHRPGEMYDGLEMFLIPKGICYDEVSYVNTPALPMCQTVEVHSQGFTDSIEVASLGDRELKAFFDMFVRKQDGNDLESVISIREGQDVNILDHQGIVAGLSMLTDNVAIEACTDGVCEWFDKHKFDDEEREYFNDSYLLFENEFNALGMEDAKLSTEARKKLKKSSFCGPDRSFPVPDCAHVTAARRLIGRAKVSASTKKKILACVNKKAANMGCDKKKDSMIDFLLKQGDALSIKTMADKLMVIRAHDHLHFMHDWDLRHAEEGGRVPPKDQFDLHQKLHKVAEDEGFNDSLVLGPMDETLTEAHPPKPAMNKDSRENNMLSFSDVTKDTASNYKLIAEHLEDDAKLSDEQLEQLEDHTFIGPGRTFPVGDLAHADAVRKVLDELEESEGMKSLLVKFLDKIEAKLKGSQADTDAETSDNVIEDSEQGDAAQDSAEDLQKQIVELKDKVEELRAMRDLLKDRSDALEKELDHASEANLEMTKAAHALLAEKVVDQKISMGQVKTEEREESIKDHASRTWESLSDTLKDLEASSKVEDGTARETDPEASIEDPTQQIDDSVDLSKYKNIVDEYKDRKMYKGQRNADMWLAGQVARGYFPAEIKIN